MKPTARDLDDAAALAWALRDFADEHGVPNQVSPGELGAVYTSLSPLRIGQLMAAQGELTRRAAKLHGVMITHYRLEGGRRWIGIDAYRPAAIAAG